MIRHLATGHGTMEIRGQGDKGTRGQGDKGTRGQGDKEIRRVPLPLHRLFPVSPCPSFALCSMLFALCSLFTALPSLAQTYQEDTQAAPEVYHESALRRFEVIFTISLPFTALHSYLAVRGVEMARQRKVSPELHRADWNAVGGLAILFSGFVAFWDWLHTRGEDISETMIVPRGRNSGYLMLDTGYWMPDIEHRGSSIQYRASSIQHPELRFLSIGF